MRDFDTAPPSGIFLLRRGERRKGQQETMGSVRIVGIDGGGPQQNLTAMLWLQAVIDRLASRVIALTTRFHTSLHSGKANLDRRSAYREIEDLLPEWMWNHLWGAVETTVPKRESGSSSDGDTSGAPPATLFGHQSSWQVLTTARRLPLLLLREALQ